MVRLLPHLSEQEVPGIALRPHSHHPPGGGEWEMVQEILEHAPAGIARDFLLHYYISAKSWPLVLLIGRPGVGKRRLFELLAGGITGCLDGRIHILPAQAAWQEGRGDGAGSVERSSLGALQGRFNTMAFLDLLAEAAAPGNEGQTYFLALDGATPEELAGYMELYLTDRPAKGGFPTLPPNLYLTAIVSQSGGAWHLPAALLDRVGVVEVTVPLEGSPAGSPYCPPVGWQRLFLRSTVRDPAQARLRLQRFGRLPDLEHLLEKLHGDLGPAWDANMEEGLLLYTANSFTVDGQGLLDRVGGANVRQAVDLQLAQRLLPCLAQRSPWNAADWSRLVARFEGIWPRAHARARRILLERNGAEAEQVAAPAPSERGTR